MKLTILTAAVALLATPVLAQDSAVQGRSGSTAGGYRTDQGSGSNSGGSGPTRQ